MQWGWGQNSVKCLTFSHSSTKFRFLAKRLDFAKQFMVAKPDKTLVLKLFWLKSWDNVKRAKGKKNTHKHPPPHTQTPIVGLVAQSKSFGKGCWSGGDYNLWCLRSAADASAERISYPQRESKFSIKGKEGSEEHVTIWVCHRLAGIFGFIESQRCPHREQWQRLARCHVSSV